eukprot:351534-Chlamydomonas_euryale.AAC.6
MPRHVAPCHALSTAGHAMSPCRQAANAKQKGKADAGHMDELMAHNAELMDQMARMQQDLRIAQVGRGWGRAGGRRMCDCRWGFKARHATAQHGMEQHGAVRTCWLLDSTTAGPTRCHESAADHGMTWQNRPTHPPPALEVHHMAYSWYGEALQVSTLCRQHPWHGAFMAWQGIAC